MNPARREILQLLAGAAILPALAGSARAQAWPARPVRIIVPFQPGGSTDIFARLAAQKLTEHFGKQFYVENIAGGAGCLLLAATLPWQSVLAGLAVFAIGLAGRFLILRQRSRTS